MLGTDRLTGGGRIDADGAFVRHRLLDVYALLALVYLLAADRCRRSPSRSTTRCGRFNYTWQGFTLEQLAALGLGYPGLRQRAASSASRSRVSRALVATALGTLIAPGARPLPASAGASTTNLLIFLPMATPEIVMGASLLTLFLKLSVAARLRRRS